MGITPMMQQYLDIKGKYNDCILFFRLGDFYEMFFEDAKTASKELEITLTGRNCGLSERAPMCGVPFHSVDTYIYRLIEKGYKVAICEQVEDPSAADGIVDREVTRIVTPGTLTDGNLIDEKKNNYLVSIYKNSYLFGLASVDITTGELFCTNINWGSTKIKLMDEMAKYSPREIIANSEFTDDIKTIQDIKKRYNTYISTVDDEWYEYEKASDIINSKFNECELFEEENNPAVNACGALLKYLEETQKQKLEHIEEIISYRIEQYMSIDASTRRNLELTETLREKSKKGTLLWVIDKTVTSMGGRHLRKWVEQPLINVYDIRQRLNSVEELLDRFMVRTEIRELLKRVYDMERLMSRIILGSTNGRELVSLKYSIGQVPYIKKLLGECSCELNKRIYGGLDTLDDIYNLIDKGIVDEPPVSIKEGGLIKAGYNKDVDKLRKASTEGKTWIASIESREREKTGIKNLKVGFNKVFGYYIEVTKSNYSLVPDTYTRKQTLVNCERFITEELKEIENTILTAEEKVIELEYELFNDIRKKIVNEVGRIKKTAAFIAQIDVLCALSETAERENYCKPEIGQSGEIKINEGRHPVVEKMLNDFPFVPNDTMIDTEENRILIITGPNMAGKSTYMRQVALIVLMAQLGSFVPAKKACIGITDRIFTRVGASDDLSSGQSTFMVEMSEVANILNNATSKSLLILDEIGRGTSTYDGLSIAWSVIEFISDRERMGCRTLFATHYHELTELEGKTGGIKNYCISVRKKGDDIIFLRKIIRGGADESYGIQVANLAGLPEKVIKRAKELLKELEDANISKNEKSLMKRQKPLEGQLNIFDINKISQEKEDVIKKLKGINITKITPMDALNILYNLKQEVTGKS